MYLRTHFEGSGIEEGKSELILMFFAWLICRYNRATRIPGPDMTSTSSCQWLLMQTTNAASLHPLCLGHKPTV